MSIWDDIVNWWNGDPNYNNQQNDIISDDEEVEDSGNLTYQATKTDPKRPQTFTDFISVANKNVVERLQLAIKSAEKRDKPLNHVLLYGNQGLGKTTLAKIIASEYKAELIETTASTINKQEDIWQLIYRICEAQDQGKRIILFIDEIHDLHTANAPETLWYPLLEDFKFYHNLEGKKIKIPDSTCFGTVRTHIGLVDPFTVIGATTDPGKLSPPLRDRFPISCFLKEYQDEDLKNILKKYSERVEIKNTDESLLELAKRARGTPRIAINLFLSCHDRATVYNNGYINNDIVLKQMHADNIDEEGLTELDLQVLEVLYKNPKGMGIGNLAGSCNMRRETIEQMVEPMLKSREYMKTTHRRFLTDKGIAVLKRKRIITEEVV